MAVKKKSVDSTVVPVIEEFGKIPPQAPELEMAVLGAIMLEKEAYFDVSTILKPESFYNEIHGIIYSAIIDLALELKPIDILTVTEKLRAKGELDKVGGPYYITQLTSRVGSAANIEFHAKIIAQKYLQRELIKLSTEIQRRAFSDSEDVANLIEFVDQEMFKISITNIKKAVQPIDMVIRETLDEIAEIGKRTDGLSGVPSGFTGIDRITQGWQKSDLVIIAARPSMGKTAFVLSMARNIAVVHKKAVVFFSLEMSANQLIRRLITAETELVSEKLRSGKLTDYEWQQLETKIKPLIEAPIFIDDTAQLSIGDLRQKCRRLKMQYDIQLIIVDYLQLMTSGLEKVQSREQEVSIISRSLKAIAKELDIPVIALSQLNRLVEQRHASKNRPQLSDLRESGAIEQDADMVLFIHRPEKYGIEEDEQGSTIGLADIIIAKHRNGATGDVRLRFRSEYAQFCDIDAYDFIPQPGQNIIKSSKMNQDILGDYGINPEGDNLFQSQTDAPF